MRCCFSKARCWCAARARRGEDLAGVRAVLDGACSIAFHPAAGRFRQPRAGAAAAGSSVGCSAGMAAAVPLPRTAWAAATGAVSAPALPGEAER